MARVDLRTVVFPVPRANRSTPSSWARRCRRSPLALLALAILGTAFGAGCSNKSADSSKAGALTSGQLKTGQPETSSGQTSPPKTGTTPAGGWEALFAEPAKKPGKEGEPTAGDDDEVDLGFPKRFTSKGPDDILQHPSANTTYDLAFTPDSRVLAVFDSAGYATLWDVKTRRGVDVSYHFRGGGLGGGLEASRSPNSRRYLVVSRDGATLIYGNVERVTVVDLPSGKERWYKSGTNLGGTYHSSNSLCVSPSANYVAVFEVPDRGDAVVRIYQVASGKVVCELPPFRNEQPLAFSPNDKLAAYHDPYEERMHIVSLSDGKEVGRINDLKNAQYFGFSADSSTLMIPDNTGKELQTWDVKRPDQPKLASKTTIQYGEWPATGVVGDATTGRRLAAQYDAGKLNKQERRKPTCVAHSPDGKLIAIGTETGEIVLRPTAGGGR